VDGGRFHRHSNKRGPFKKCAHYAVLHSGGREIDALRRGSRPRENNGLILAKKEGPRGKSRAVSHDWKKIKNDAKKRGELGQLD